MEEKYGEPFYYVAPWGSTYAKRGVTQILVAGGFDIEVILVEASKDNGSYNYSDNFLAIKYRQDVSDLIKNTVDFTFGESINFYEVAKVALPPGLTSDASFDNYIKNPGPVVSAIVLVPYSHFNGMLLSEFTESFQGLGITVVLRFLVIDDSGFYTVTPGDISDW